MPWSEERSPPQPYFEQTPASVMVRPGHTVQIPCRVRNLGDKIVSILGQQHTLLGHMNHDKQYLLTSIHEGLYDKKNR